MLTPWAGRKPAGVASWIDHTPQSFTHILQLLLPLVIISQILMQNHSKHTKDSLVLCFTVFL